jgi:polysaccharide biosynthesis protein PslH
MRHPAERPRCLFLAPECPYPLAGGGALRAASLLHYLAQRYDVDAVMFREPGAADPRSVMPAGLVRDLIAIDLPAHRKTVAAKVWRTAGRLARRVPPLIDRFGGFAEQVGRSLAGRSYELGLIEHFWCAGYQPELARCCRQVALDLHNIESMLHARCARTEPRAVAAAHGVFAAAAERLEREWLPRFSQLLVTSAEDAERVGRLAPDAPVSIYPNAIPSVPMPEVPVENAIVFSGNLEYHPNGSAVRFFRQSIWPLLRERWPELRWRLIGRNPGAVRRYTEGDARIEVTGPVADAIVELARGKVAVVPLLAGSGTRFKILEAWAAGVPVVSTALGAEGLAARSGEELLIADEPEAFAEAVSEVLESELMRSRLRTAGRSRLERDFTWEAAWKSLHL